MSNVLTGDFDVVVEASVPAVNRVLAALHQGGSFLHSFTLRIDDTPAAIYSLKSEFTGVGGLTRVQAHSPAVQIEGAPPVHPHPGEGGLYQTEYPGSPEFARVQASTQTPQTGRAPHPIDPGIYLRQFTGIRGFAEIQVSPPTITLPQSADTSEVTVHQTVMAHFLADPGTPPMPEFLHGELQATVDVDQVVSQVGNVLEIDFTREDIPVSFNPVFADPPLSPGQNDRINRVIHSTLATTFQPMNAVLPGIIHQIDFKSLPNASQPTAALLLNLRPDAPPNPDPNSVTRGFLNADDQFAIAVGFDYIKSIVDEAVGSQLSSFNLSFSVLGLDYHVEVINYSIMLVPPNWTFFALNPGILLTINVEIITPPGLPNVNVAVYQSFLLSIEDGQVTIDADGDPTLNIQDGLMGAIVGHYTDEIVANIRQNRDAILDQVRPLIRAKLDSSKTLGAVLNALNISATLTYTSIEIQWGGLILHGTLDVPNFAEFAHVEFSSNLVSVNGVTQLEMNALNSWIPGGTIQEYDWTVPSSGHVLRDRHPVHHISQKAVPSNAPSLVETNVATMVTDTDRFILRVSSSFSASQWCLSMQGTRITALGTPAQETVSGVSFSCALITVVAGLIQGDNSLVRRLTFVVPGYEATTRTSGVLAHVAPWGTGRAIASGETNMLVHFADSHIEANLSEIRDALSASSKNDSAVLVVAVLPREHRKVQPVDFGTNGTLALAEDHQEAWRRVFSVKEVPVTYLVNPEGQVVWQHIGRLHPAGLTEAFNEHLIPGGRLLWQPLRLAVQQGDPAPDFLFEYTPGRELALRRLRGRPVLLHFWTSWSEPHLEELRYLQKVYDEFSRRRLVILAINDGEPPEHAREVFRENGFPFPLITDTSQQISRLYGVNCWPTTVSINERGLVSGIQFGLTPGGSWADLVKLPACFFLP